MTAYDERFPREVRLRRQRDFDRVYQSKIYAADRTLVISACANSRSKTRLGVAVSRRFGNAVQRNYWKRLIREVFRRCRHRLPTGLDIVVRPRRGAEPRYVEVACSLPRLVERVDRPARRGSP